MLTIQNLSKIYTNGTVETRALDSVSCVISDGEFVSIVGRSGAGKSTLLYQLGLLDTPTTGEVYIDGTATHNLLENEKTKIRLAYYGFVFQDYALLPELTAVENVMIPLLMQGLHTKQAYERSMAVLQDLGLGDRTDRLPNQLSGGQQQRVSIARALAVEPKIICADEPTANLDSANGKQVIELLQEINRTKGTTILLVTHEDEYIHAASRVITLSDGVIVSDQKS